MKQLILKNDIVFFTLCFVIWAQVIFLIHGDHAYFGIPIGSILKNVNIKKEFSQKKVIVNTINELYSSLKKEERPIERGHILHNMGSSYYDLHKVMQRIDFLDSSEYYYKQSINVISDNPRFYYNLGFLYTEYRNHKAAKQYYEKTVELKPDHILALHNLALLNYYELGNKEIAKKLLGKVLSIQPNSPACHYTLGAIFEEEGNYPNAINHYNKEITTCYNFIKGNISIPVSKQTLKYALLKSHRRLALLYSTVKKNKGLAKKNLDAYLRLEQDEKEKKNTLNKLNKYWQLKIGL